VPRALAATAFAGLLGALGLALLVQAFFAGEAALIAPQDWALHLAWIHLFQWLSVALPPAAYLARRRLRFTLLNCVPIVLIGLQYSLIHLALRRGAAALAGLHAVGGMLLFGVVLFIAQEWRYRDAIGAASAPAAPKTPP
jgi:hypothetical protein